MEYLITIITSVIVRLVSTFIYELLKYLFKKITKKSR